MKQKVNLLVKAITLVAVLLVTFASCGMVSEDGGETEVSINLPYVNGTGSRAIDASRADALMNETALYRVHMNDRMREGTGGNFSAYFAVGTKVDVFIECVNAKGEVILRTVTKSLVVASGKNVINFNLKADGTEITPPAPPPVTGRVIYSYGDADIHGVKGGLPTDGKNYEVGEFFEVSSDTPTWEHSDMSSGNGFNGWSSSVPLESENGGSTTTTPQAGQRYKMPAGGVTLVAQWTPTQYTITYNTDITSGSGSPQQASGGATSFTMAEKDDKHLSSTSDSTGANTFMGWATASGAGTPNINGTSDIRKAVANGSLQIGGNNNVTLYAVWTSLPTHVVTFVDSQLAGQEYWQGNTTNNTVNIIDGQSVSAQQIQSFLNGGAKSGYTLTYSGSGSGAITSTQDFTVQASNVSFNTTYTVALNADALNGQEYWQGGSANTVQVQKGQSVTVQQIQTFLTGGAKSGYTLTYSGSGSGAINSKTDADAGFAIQANNVSFNTTYTVALNADALNGQEYWQGNSANTVQVQKGQSVTSQQIRTFLTGGAKSGYTLTYSGSGSGAINSKTDADAGFAIDASKVSFNTTYTVTLDASALNGQEYWQGNSANTVQVQKGQSVTAQQIRTFLTGGAKSGYTLTYSGSGSSAINSKANADAGFAIDASKVSFNTTYTVTIDFSGVLNEAWWQTGSDTTATKSVAKGGQLSAQDIQTEINSRKKSNYNVTYTRGNKTISSESNINVAITTGDLTVKELFSITYNWGSSGVTVTSELPQTQNNIVQGTNATVTIPTVQADYTFLGWSETDGATSATYKTGKTTIASVTQNYTLYAVWARTVLYQDGTLIINELPTASRQDATTAVYAAMEDNGSNYVFSAISDCLWYNDRASITSVKIGSDIRPKNTRNWFAEMSNCTSIDLTKLNTSSVSTMQEMFRDCSSLTSLDLSNFNTSNVTTMQSMFYGCSKLTSLDLSKFNTIRVTIMGEMFTGCSSLTSLDLSNFDTSYVTNMYQMFTDCSQLARIYASDEFRAANVLNSFQMFYNCSALVGGQGTQYNVSNINNTYARIDAPGKPGYFTEKQP